MTAREAWQAVDKIRLDMQVSYWADKEVWVSGATGAWGQEIIRQLLLLPVKRVVGCCRGEHRAFDLAQKANDTRLQIYLTDIRDGKRVERSLSNCGVAIHTAALKRVDAFTYSPTEIHDTNVNGTIRVIEGVIKQGVGVGFYVSSDKACQPTTFYGGTKFLAEQLWLSAGDCGPEMKVGRFGNAIDSTGAVLGIWKKQRDAGLPLTLTDPDMTRFFMTVKGAVGQILDYLIPIGGSGQVLAPALPAFRLADLAEAVAPGHPVEVAGARGYGEKMHETMLIRADGEVIRSDCATLISVQGLRGTLEKEGLL